MKSTHSLSFFAWICVLNGLFIALMAKAATPTLVVRGAWPDTANDIIEGVAVNGNYAYLANGYSGLRILSLTNPAVPTLSGALPLAGLVRGVAVAGDLAYLADWRSNCLHIVNVSQPSTPRLESSYSTYGPLIDVEASGHYAYVAGYMEGVMVFDAADPKHPVRLASYPMNRCNALVLQDRYVYAAGIAAGLSIIDVSDAARPVLASVYKNGASEVMEVAASGSRAYVLERDPNASIPAMTLSILDLTDVTHPVALGRLPLSPAYWYLAVTNNLILAGSVQSRLALINVSDPARPAFLSAHAGSPAASSSASSGRPLMAGGLIYWPVGDHGLEILSIEQAPAISVSRSKVPGLMQVGWERAPGARLQMTRDLLNSPWEDVVEPGGAVADTVMPLEGNAFFRVIRKLP